MVAFNPIVPPFAINMSDAVEVRIVATIDLAIDAPTGLGFIGHNCHRAMQPHSFNCLVQKGCGSFCIAPRGEAKVDHLAVGINSPPEISPLSTDMPIDARPAQVLLCSFGDHWTKLDHPPIHSGLINVDPTLHEQVQHVLIEHR